MEFKTVKFEVKEVNEEEGTFTGYASTFTDVPDSYGDVVDKGAFKKTIKENKGRIKHLWNHNTNEPIGKPDEMYEDDTGLFIKGRLVLGVQRARETLALMKAGVVNEMSIGYDTITDTVVKGIRHLKEVKLYDVSPVCFAANPSAVILSAKSEDQRNEDLRILALDLEGVKAGRVLSAASIAKLRAALDTIQALLASAESEAEPEKSTHLDNEEVKGAAELDVILAGLKAENVGFSIKAAEERLTSILAQIKN